MNANPLHKAIYEKIVLPELSKISYDAEGIVIGVDYYQQLVDIQWIERGSGAVRTARRVSIPRDGDGIYKQAISVGDRVKVSFLNGHHAYPYIDMVYSTDSKKEDYRTESGSSIPRGIGF